MGISHVYHHISEAILDKTEIAHIRNRLISYNIACQRLNERNPVPLLKFQVATVLRFIISSGSTRRNTDMQV